MMLKYIGSDFTSLVTLPVHIFEPMTMLQKLAELMEYSHLLDRADECEDPYMRLVYASSWAISVYYAYKRTWKPFNLVLGETYENINHGGITFLAEQFHRQQAQADLENVARLREVVARLEMENEQLRRSQTCDQPQPQSQPSTTNHSNSDSDH